MITNKAKLYLNKYYNYIIKIKGLDELTSFALDFFTYDFFIDVSKTGFTSIIITFIICASVFILPASAAGTVIAFSQNTIVIGDKVVVETATGNTITIFDMTGRVVYNGVATAHRNEIALHPGMYIANGVKVIIR